MKLTRRISGYACTLLLLAAVTAGAATTLPNSSIYQLAVPLQDQSGRAFRLDERRGRPMLVTMLYTSCQYTCPLLISALKSTDEKLTPDERKRISILAVSFDPVRDDVAKLKQTADEHELDLARWTLARPDAKSTRKLAAVLGIQYRALPDGDFNHTSVVLLIDAEGRIVGRTSQLGTADPVFVKLVQRTLQNG